MPGFLYMTRKAGCWLPIILWTSGLNAQTRLKLSPATITADGTALLDLSLYSSPGTEPAAVQWTFQYQSSSISSLTVDDGPMLTLAGKAAFCAGDASAYRCMAAGANMKTIASGVIAKVTAVLAPGASTATIQITNCLGASTAGSPIPISSIIIPATGAKASSDASLYPLKTSIGSQSRSGS